MPSRDVEPIKSLAKFWEWVEGLRGTEMLFRGLSKKSYLGERGGKRLVYLIPLSSFGRRCGQGQR